MANYKDIHGTTVRNSAGNLSGAKEGELFFDSTNLDFKYQFPAVTSTGAWRTGNNMTTGRMYGAGAGTQTAGLAFNGEAPPDTAKTEQYDGTSWTEVGDMNIARQQLAGNGTQTSALGYGGIQPTDYNDTESWNGSSWTETTNLNTGRYGPGVGTGASNTSALFSGGRASGGSNSALVESWDGSSWTEVADLNTARYATSGFGTVTSTLAFGGQSTATESWNGSSWTTVTALNTERQHPGAGGTDNTSGLAFGGGPPVIANTELWNGSSWTETGDLSVARYGLDGGGNKTAALESWRHYCFYRRIYRCRCRYWSMVYC